MRRLVLGLAFATLTTGLACGPASPPKAPDAVVQRAAFDLSCPAEQLSFLALAKSSPRSFGVTGCSKKATYIELCSIAMYGMITNKSCQWTIDGGIQSNAAGPPPVQSATGPAPASS
jgi:hypothetical protein